MLRKTLKKQKKGIDLELTMRAKNLQQEAPL